MILAPAEVRHAPAMAPTHAEAFEIGWSAAELADCLTAPGGFGFIAAARLDAPMVAGFVLARAIAGEAEILTIAVAKAHRGRGVARALMRAAADRAVACGAMTLFLEVATDNLAALALYEGLGFQAAGVRRAYYRRPGRPAGDAIVLRRDLNTGLG